MKLYDRVKQLLEDIPLYRSSDKSLIWTIVAGTNPTLSYEKFMSGPSVESITRARRKVQENHPYLQATESIRAHRNKIARQKGTHVYREKIKSVDARRSIKTSEQQSLL